MNPNQTLDKDQIKQRLSIQDGLEHYGAKLGTNGVHYHCPCPQNHKNGDANPSVTVKGDRANCWSQGCFGKGGVDIFGLIGVMEGISEFPAQMAKACEIGRILPNGGGGNGTVPKSYKPKENAEILRAYCWTDKSGNERYHLRMSGERKFLWNEKPDGSGAWNKGACKFDLYERKAVEVANHIILVEGEHDADTVNKWLTELGKTPQYVATCTPNGAADVKDEYLELLKGKSEVFSSGDNDDPGTGYRTKCLEILDYSVASLNVLEVPLGPKDWAQWKEEGATAQDFLKCLAAARPHKSQGLRSAVLSFQSLLSLQIPERKNIFPFLPEGGSAMVFGPRGQGKTFLLLGMAASLVTATSFFKWGSPPLTSVLYIDGEMDLSQLRERMTALMPKPPNAKLHFLTSRHVYDVLQRDLVLTDPKVRQEITKILDGDQGLRFVIFDNISCLFSGISEDSKEDWEPIAAWLVHLRHRGVTVVVVHHAGKGGQQRGTSGREDSLDTVIRLSQPAGYSPKEGCHFEVHFTKCRSAKGDDLDPLDAKLCENSGELQWIYKSLSISKEEEVLKLVDEGVDRPTDIAEELGISRGYACKLLKKVKRDKNGSDF